MLNIGERVFIADYGAGYIQDIASSELYFIKDKYVSIYLLLDNMNFMIPIDKIENYKIRNILSKMELETTLFTILSYPDYIESNWNNRYRTNKKKIQSGSTLKMCQVIRDLYYLKRENMLPPGETKILERVEGMVASEIMLVLELNMEQALSKIRNLV
ncbi:transcriptional regulator [Clostridium tagluense]|uniref:CarD family transcriptional regulator n=1 Tax=Clostridium tagluense TaxID=360422 RepID=UPI001C0BE11A|nr:CarD family transcriptional regulator [Clostridium tagluense]MBU3128600.1 transcriptional regulator [Clostridium tagluense]MCB2313276.1 transcriptional regulator [Clostridium tagluense]MCB2318042.1 transcriptional regulator [Clostridium tagluense]MCB2322901.1 transcriptional regulator [Clostridium tagluense]MCB2327826.1 transcriptional regulator [Clostridium tagluense]